MTAIKPTNTELREKINDDKYNLILNQINSKYTEMNKYIGNLQSDILSILEFEKTLKKDKEVGYDIGTALDTLSFQRISLEIDLNFFIKMKDVCIKKLYGDLYKYCCAIIDVALTIEVLPDNTILEDIKQTKLKGVKPYPPPNTNSNGLHDQTNELEEKYDMNEIFELINATTANLRELADDIGSFSDRINSAKDKESRGFSVGNLIMNLQSQQQKLVLEYDNYIIRLDQFLQQNKNFSDRCLNRITLISKEIVSKEELEESTDTEIKESTDTEVKESTDTPAKEDSILV